MKVCICTPTHSGQVYVPFVVSLTDAVKALTVAGIEVQWKALSFSSFIQCAREKMVREFLETDYTDLVFIDADIGFDLEGFLRMLSRDVDVIGVPCPKRKDPLEYVIREIARGELIECAYIGTALLRIRRNVIEKMARCFDAGFEGDRFIGEDAWFCREWRRLGGKIWAEPDVRVTHTGPKEWVGRY